MKRALLFAFILGACAGEEARTLPSKGGQGGIPSGSISVANRTDADLEVVIADPLDLRIDRRVLERAIDVPIPRALFSTERSVRVAPGEITAGGTEIEVLTGGTPDRKQAAMIGIPGGPLFLAIGMGQVIVRTQFDGTRAIEALDPKTVTLLPVDDEHSECAAGTLDNGFRLVDGSLSSIGGNVTSVTRDAEGCRLFTAREDPYPSMTMRVCIPDAVYPFADAEPLRFRLDNGSAELGSTWRIENEAGDSLRLVHAWFFDDLTDSIESLTLVARDDPSCARIAECGVDVPAKLTYAVGDTPRRAVTFGEPIADTGEPSRTYVVLRARARPVASGSCISQEYATTDTTRAHAWLVTIEKGKPR